MRPLLASAAHWLSEMYLAQSEFWLDVEVWLTTQQSWDEVREWRRADRA